MDSTVRLISSSKISSLRPSSEVGCFGAGQRPRIKVFLTLGLHHVSRFQKKNKQNQLSKATAAYQFNVKNLKLRQTQTVPLGACSFVVKGRELATVK